MQIDLERAIDSCREAVDAFAVDLKDDERVCLETRSLAVASSVTARIYSGVWTEERSKEVEEIFKKAIDAHERFAKEHGSESEYADRLHGRFQKMKDIFIHPPYEKPESFIKPPSDVDAGAAAT